MAGLYDIIRQVAPGWASKAPRAHWGLWLDVVALFVDVLTELADEARTAALPGQVDLPGIANLGGFLSVDALSRIGDDRLVVRGLAESDSDYATRLRRYLDDWAIASTDFGLLDQLSGVLSAPGRPRPLLRLVNGRGYWSTLEPDGTYRFQNPLGTGFEISPEGAITPDATFAIDWDWDSATVPANPDQDDDTRVWVIIYPPCAGLFLTDTDHTAADPGVVGDGWDDLTHGGYELSPDAGTCGTNAKIALVENVRAVGKQRRSAGYLIAYFIIAFDPDSFNPDGSSAGTDAYPDGHWGYSNEYDAGTDTMVPSRLDTAEYWPGEPGGLAP